MEKQLENKNQLKDMPLETYPDEPSPLMVVFASFINVML
jgi:hypothetical protein